MTTILSTKTLDYIKQHLINQGRQEELVAAYNKQNWLEIINEYFSWFKTKEGSVFWMNMRKRAVCHSLLSRDFDILKEIHDLFKTPEEPPQGQFGPLADNPNFTGFFEREGTLVKPSHGGPAFSPPEPEPEPTYHDAPDNWKGPAP